MGKVIPFKKNPNKPVQTRHSSVGLHKNIAPLIPGLESELNRIGIEIDPVLKIRAYLNSLQGYISQHAIATGRNILKNYTLEELKTFAKNSNENQWNAKPGYFVALCDEIDARG